MDVYDEIIDLWLPVPPKLISLFQYWLCTVGHWHYQCSYIAEMGAVLVFFLWYPRGSHLISWIKYSQTKCQLQFNQFPADVCWNSPLCPNHTIMLVPWKKSSMCTRATFSSSTVCTAKYSETGATGFKLLPHSVPKWGFFCIISATTKHFKNANHHFSVSRTKSKRPLNHCSQLFAKYHNDWEENTT